MLTYSLIDCHILYFVILIGDVSTLSILIDIFLIGGLTKVHFLDYTTGEYGSHTARDLIKNWCRGTQLIDRRLDQVEKHPFRNVFLVSRQRSYVFRCGILFCWRCTVSGTLQSEERRNSIQCANQFWTVSTIMQIILQTTYWNLTDILQSSEWYLFRLMAFSMLMDDYKCLRRLISLPWLFQLTQQNTRPVWQYHNAESYDDSPTYLP